MEHDDGYTKALVMEDSWPTLAMIEGRGGAELVL